MKDILFSLYLEYCRLQDKHQQLVRNYNNIWDRRERLQNRCDMLEQRVEELETVEKEYGRIRHVLGAHVVDTLLRRAKEKELMITKVEKEKQRLQQRKNRDMR